MKWYKTGTQHWHRISVISFIAPRRLAIEALSVGQNLGCRRFFKYLLFLIIRTHNPKVVGSNPAPATKVILGAYRIL